MDLTGILEVASWDSVIDWIWVVRGRKESQRLPVLWSGY